MDHAERLHGQNLCASFLLQGWTSRIRTRRVTEVGIGAWKRATGAPATPSADVGTRTLKPYVKMPLF